MASPLTVKANFCPHCGTSVGAEDRFCRSCGTEIRRPGAADTPQATSIPDVIDTWPKMPSEAPPSAKEKKDKWHGVRVVLLLATALSAFIAPWLVTAFLGLLWVITLVLPSD